MKSKITIGILLVLLTISLSGCIDRDNITTDAYRCAVDDGILYLSSNHEYELLIDEVHGGGGIFGNYSIREDIILLKRDFLGDLLCFTADGRDLIDPDGDRWVRD